MDVATPATRRPAARAQGGTKAANRLAKKNGPLGKKGRETRRLLMSAARGLLDRVSPLTISAAAVSKEAGTAPATFYVYFENVEDILWALCNEISVDTSDLFADDNTLRIDERLEDDALAFVEGYAQIWARHGPLLLYRNLESDRGNKRFSQLVTRIALPILGGLTDRIVAATATGQPISRAEANAEAVVLVAAIDRIAAAIFSNPEDAVAPDLLLRAQARVLTRMLRRD